MNLAFIGPLRHAGLALSIGLASCLNAVLLYRGLRRRQVYAPRPGWTAFGGKLAVALAGLALVAWFGSGPDEAWLRMAAQERLLRLSAIVAAGAATYFGALRLLGFRLRDFTQRGAD
jgi:putative peptidoglycan lipid II flippase